MTNEKPFQKIPILFLTINTVCIKGKKCFYHITHPVRRNKSSNSDHSHRTLLNFQFPIYCLEYRHIDSPYFPAQSISSVHLSIPDRCHRSCQYTKLSFPCRHSTQYCTADNPKPSSLLSAYFRSPRRLEHELCESIPSLVQFCHRIDQLNALSVCNLCRKILSTV